MSNNKDYSSIYTMEEFMLNSIAPLYFNMDEINQFNIGLFGYTTHTMADMGDDVSNMVSALHSEITPVTAKQPSTIYANAALYRMDDIYAKPAKLNILLMIGIDELLANLTKEKDTSYIKFDSNTVIDIDGMPFMLANDLIINVKAFKGEYKYIVRYDNVFSNDVADTSSSPYLRSIVVNTELGDMLCISCDVYQMYKIIEEDSIVNNKTINFPKFYINFSDMLANFEVFYRDDDTKDYIQLSKVLKNSAPLETPFCYYTMSDTNELEISFSSRDKYFMPAYNSDIKIEYYTTTGSNGNFDEYVGSLENIEIQLKSDKFSSNSNLKVYAIPQNGAVGGTDSLTLEEIKNKVSVKFATVDTIITEQDLQLYFANLNNVPNVKMLFRKRRDDIFRLFSAFSLYKDRNNTILHTHTLDTSLIPSSLIRFNDDSIVDIIKPGTLFQYKDPSPYSNDYSVIKIDDTNLNSYYINKGRSINNFLFTSPFLINIMHEPTNMVGLYLNSIDDTFSLDYTYNNLNAEDQFIYRDFSIKRNAMKDEDEYEISISIVPSSKLTFDIVDNMGLFTNRIKIMCAFYDNGVETSYIPLDFLTYEAKTNTITFTGYLKTDDYVSLSQKIRCTNVIDINTGKVTTKLIPYLGSIFHINVFTLNETSANNHKYTHLDEYKFFKLSNIYSTIKDDVNLILPYSFIRTSMTYEDDPSSSDGYRINLKELPLVSAEDMLDENKVEDLLKRLNEQYRFLSEAVELLENNFSIDLKFIGTYGKSKMFKTEKDENLDRLNCGINLEIHALAGVDVELLKQRLDMIISDFFDSINVVEDRSIKISNLINILDDQNEVSWLRFNRINDYDANVQVLKNNTPTVTDALADITVADYIPEYVTVRPEDIHLDIVEG